MNADGSRLVLGRVDGGVGACDAGRRADCQVRRFVGHAEVQQVGSRGCETVLGANDNLRPRGRTRGLGRLVALYIYASYEAERRAACAARPRYVLCEDVPTSSLSAVAIEAGAFRLVPKFD